LARNYGLRLLPFPAELDPLCEEFVALKRGDLSAVQALGELGECQKLLDMLSMADLPDI